MQSKICVLQVIPNLDVSGASQGCVDVANFLSEKNYNSYILTHSGPKTSEVKDYNEKVFYASVNSKNPIIIFFNRHSRTSYSLEFFLLFVYLPYHSYLHIGIIT